jgi:hypothetical protein
MIMRNFLPIVVCALVLTLIPAAYAQRVEVSAALSPVFAGDPALEALASDAPAMPRLGADIRVLVWTLAGFDFLPLVSYRYTATEGGLGEVETRLTIHDLGLGLRLRRDLLPFMAFFAQVEAGLALVDLKASLMDNSSSRSTARDEDRLWEAGGSVGLAFGPSKGALERRGIRRFSFAGELSGGYLARGEASFSPRLERGDEHSLSTISPVSWGGVDTSGWFAQMAFTVKFL